MKVGGRDQLCDLADNGVLSEVKVSCRGTRSAVSLIENRKAFERHTHIRDPSTTIALHRTRIHIYIVSLSLSLLFHSWRINHLFTCALRSSGSVLLAIKSLHLAYILTIADLETIERRLSEETLLPRIPSEARFLILKLLFPRAACISIAAGVR